jgi:hypothetical protein
MSEIRDYDDGLVKTILHIEDINTRFALQNYAAAGAVFLAYFTEKIPNGLATLAIVVISIVFTSVISLNARRHRFFWKMHRIARDCWLAGETSLANALRADTECRQYLEATTLPWSAYFPVIITNLLPAFAALLLFMGPPKHC